jgi:3'5'-cyclic nucleotide phosphodiesterase
VSVTKVNVLGTILLQVSNGRFVSTFKSTHVAASVNKRLAQVKNCSCSNEGYERDPTSGFVFDPAKHFAVVLAALIHAVDHPGVANDQLVKEQPGLALLHGNQSVASHNAVRLAWGAFVSDDFGQLQRIICDTQDESHQFQRLLKDCVLAADAMSRDTSAMRVVTCNDLSGTCGIGKASLVQEQKEWIFIKQLIQTSNIAHAMHRVCRDFGTRLGINLLTHTVTCLPFSGRSMKNGTSACLMK